MQNVNIPSDSLSQLRELISRDPQLLAYFGVPLQIRLVVDTNCVLSDLLWLAGKRQNPAARTNLQEVIDAGVVIVFAPLQLCEEVKEHIPRLAREQRIAEALLWQEWQSYQKDLRFCDVGSIHDSVDRPIADPDDLPFVALSAHIGAAAIVSRDHHIAAMGANMIGQEVVIQLREYARAKSIELTIKLGGYSLTVVVTGSAMVIAKLVAILVQSFARLPVWLQLAVLAGVGIGILHPYSRTMIGEILRKGSDSVDGLATKFEPTLKTLGAETLKAANALHCVQQALPQRRQAGLETVAFSVCLAAGEPLLLREIARRVLSGGYLSRSLYFEDYLRKVMRNSPRFVRGADGCWTISQYGIEN